MRFIDLAVLAVLVERRDDPPPKVTLWNPVYSRVNQWLEAQGVFHYGYLFTQPVTSTKTIDTAIQQLRNAKLISPEAPYVPTCKGLDLLEELGDDWTSWPLSIPVRGGKLIFEEAQYAPALV